MEVVTSSSALPDAEDAEHCMGQQTRDPETLSLFPPADDSDCQRFHEYHKEFTFERENASWIGQRYYDFIKKTPKREAVMGYFLQKFDTFLTRTFFKLGKCIASNTGYFIIVPLLLTALLATGFQQMVYEDNPEYLFAPSNGRAKQERAVVQEFFKQNATDDYNPARASDRVRFTRFLLIAKDKGNLLREEIWEDIMELDRIMKEDIIVTVEEKDYKFPEVCVIWEEECLGNDILDIGELIPEINNKTYNLSYPIMINPNTFSLYIFPFYFGGITLDEDQAIESVEALSLFYTYRADDELHEQISNQIEIEVKEFFTTHDFEKIKVSFFTTKTMEAELEANTNSVVPYFAMTVSIMLLFCMFSVTMGDCVRSKTLLGLVGVLCAFLSCAAAFGALSYLGVPFIGINLAAPFLMLGIGIDDTFVMLAAWRRTRIHDDVGDRLAHSFADAAVSITITSLTDMVSFFIGAITPFPSVQIFCVYTGSAVFMTYLWHITLFGACLAIAGRAEKKQLHNITFRPVKAMSQSHDESFGYRMCCAGGINPADPWHPEDNRRHSIMVFFRDYVAAFLNIPAVKALVVMLFIAYLSVAIWGCTKVKEGLERRKLSRYDSYSVEFYDMDDTYFRAFPYRIQMIIVGELDYNNKTVQDKVLKYLEEVENHPHVAEALYTESWLRSFLSFMERNGDYLGLNNTDEQTFIENLQEHQLSGKGNPYAKDVIFNEDHSKIIASRFMIQGFNVTGAEEDKKLMTDLRDLADNSEFNVTFYMPLFIFFDQFTLVRSISIQAISLAAAVMMVVSLIFIPNPLCSLWVAFSIISIEVGVVGYMSLWGVNLDSISMIQLIMCIGFSVDFSAHISYAYLAAKVDTPEERVKECLYALGLPIVQGGLSTILGIMALIMAPSYIFITFFKTVFLVIFFGAVHGIFLLPVLLSLFGPGSCKKKKEKTEPANINGAPIYCKKHNIYNGNPMKPIPGTIHYPSDPVPIIPRPKTIKSSPSYRISAITAEPSPYKNSRTLNDSTTDGITLRQKHDGLERDLGIGTSGEESSESSLKQGETRKSNTTSARGSPASEDAKTKRTTSFRAHTNKGYVSDEFEAQQTGSRYRENEQYGQWENMKPTNNQKYYRSSSARNGTTDNYVNERYARHSSPSKKHGQSSREHH